MEAFWIALVAGAVTMVGAVCSVALAWMAMRLRLAELKSQLDGKLDAFIRKAEEGAFLRGVKSETDKQPPPS